MRILFLTHFFPPEELSGAFLVKELADAAADRGHEVDVLTGYPNWPTGKCFAGYAADKFTHEMAGKLNVYRLPFFAAPNGSFFKRVLDFKSFEFNAYRFGKTLRRPDVIFVPIPANEDALAARRLARHFSCKYVVNVQDIQPDSAIALGYIRNPLAIKLLRRQEKTIYADAAHVVAIGDNFRRQLENKGIPPGKISVLPNWINAEEVQPQNRANALRAEWGIPEDKFVVLYAGTFGRIHGTELLLEAARLVEDAPGVLFLMVGQGYGFEQCRETAAQKKIQNVVVREFVPRSRLGELQAIADVSVVTLRPGFGHTSVPSKVLGYMSAGRSVLALADRDCDTARLIDDAKCGIVLEPGDAGRLAEEILDLHSKPELVRLLGENARRYIVSHLDVKIVAPMGVDLLEIIHKAASKSEKSAATAGPAAAIRRATSLDVGQILDVHFAAFPRFPATMLGDAFLRTLYASFIEDRRGICFVAEADSRVVGFVVGAIQPQFFFRKLLVKKGALFLWSILKPLIRHPGLVISRAAMALFYRGEKPEAISGDTAVLLSSMAVMPDFSGQGIGASLVRAFCGECRQQGMDVVYLTTDNLGNDSVNRFYVNRGFRLLTMIERPGGRFMNTYQKTLDQV